MSKRLNLSELVYAADKFLEREIAERTWVVPGVIPHPSIGMLYAWRGSGKTFTGLDLGLAVANNAPWMPYESPDPAPRRFRHESRDGEYWHRRDGPRRVLYVDGEMPLSDMKERIKNLARGRELKRFFVLSSEDAAEAQIDLNLADSKIRRALLQLVYDLDIEFVIMDNWMSLVRGLDENDNAELDDIKKWLIHIRHCERSVLVIHHAGKSGVQRGASAREDALDYSLVLKQVERAEKRSVFEAEWDKVRGAPPQPEKFYMELTENGEGELHFRLGEKPSERRKKQGRSTERPSTRDAILLVLKEDGPQTRENLYRRCNERFGTTDKRVRNILPNLVKNRVIKKDDQDVLSLP